MSVPAVAGGRTAEQFIRYLAQQVAALGSGATDFNRLSVLRTIAELQALLGERFEEELLVMVAEGVDRAAYRSFGFNALPASRAYGTVTFSRKFSGNDATSGSIIAPYTIPKGTNVRVPGTTKVFSTYSDVVFPGLTQNGLPNPTQPLSLSFSVATTTYSAGLWSLGYTFSYNSGETLLSPTSNINLPSSATYGIAVPYIPMPVGVTAINYYLLAPGTNTYGLTYTSNTGAATILTATPTATAPPTQNTTAQGGIITVQNANSTVIASTVGSAWNTNSGTITELASPINPINGTITVTNLGDITTGEDNEDDEARRLRFSEYIQSIHRATSDSIEFGLKTYASLTDPYNVITEKIYSAQVVDTAIAGIANCYVWNGQALTSPAVSLPLQKFAQQIINGYIDANGNKISGYKAAGAQVNILNATIVPTNIDVTIYPDQGITFPMIQEGVRTAILQVFGRTQVGDINLKASDLRYAVGSVRGVIDHAFMNPASITSPTLPPTVSAITQTGGMVDPQVPPAVGYTKATSTIPAGTWQLVYTNVYSYGETLPSVAVTTDIPTSNIYGIYVPNITLATGVTSINYYLAANGSSNFYYAGNSTTGLSVVFTSIPTTGTQPPVTNGTTRPNPTTTQTLTPASGTSTLPAGAGQFAYTFTNANGETLLSTPSTFTIATANAYVLPVSASTLPSWATGINYYLKTGGGSIWTLSAQNAGAAINLTAPGPSYTPSANTTGQPSPSLFSYSVTITTSASTLASGRWNVAYTFYNNNGETALSPASQVTVTSTNTQRIVIPAVPIPANSVGIRYYLSLGNGPFGLVGSANSSAIYTAQSVTTTLPPIGNTTGTPLSGSSFLAPGNYQISYSWATLGGQTLASPVSATIPVLGGQALSATIPGTVLDPAIQPPVSTTVLGAGNGFSTAGAYSVGFTFTNTLPDGTRGETRLSPITTVTLPGDGSTGFTIYPISLPSNATGIRYYTLVPGATAYTYVGQGGANTTISIGSATPGNPPGSVNTTGVPPTYNGGVYTTVNWYVSPAPFTTTPTTPLVYSKTTTGNIATISYGALDLTKTAPTGNTSANIGGGVGKIIVPGTININLGSS